MNNSINLWQFAKENARNQQWTQEERGTLRTYVTKNCGVPLSNSEEFWQNCATHLSEVHGWLRTGMLFRIIDIYNYRVCVNSFFPTGTGVLIEYNCNLMQKCYWKRINIFWHLSEHDTLLIIFVSYCVKLWKMMFSIFINFIFCLIQRRLM